MPDDVLDKLREISQEVVEELANQDEFSRRVYDSYSQFKRDASAWSDISERAYLNIR